MTVKIDINKSDIWNLNKYFLLHDPKSRGALIVNMIAWPLMLFSILTIIRIETLKAARIPHGQIITPTIIIATILGGLLFDLLIFFSIKYSAIKRNKLKTGTMGEHIIEVTENGIKESTSVNESFISWPAVNNVYENEENIFIFIDRIQAHIIPKRAFNTADEAVKFFSKATEYWKNAKN